MCGICAGIGKINQVEIVTSGLKKLEYRGYDSSGIAYFENGKIKTIKSVGKIENLCQKIPKSLTSNCVIGHTRWATHGKVCEKNCHPQISASGRIALVHNGIIENHQALRKILKRKKYHSQTDSEVLAELIDNQNGEPLEKIIEATKMCKGSFAIAVMKEGEEKIFAGKRDGALIVAKTKFGCICASDISILDGNCEFFYVLQDNEFAILSQDKIEVFDNNGQKICKKPQFLCDFEFENFKETTDFYMKNEIYQQPCVLLKTFDKYFGNEVLSEETLQKIRKFSSFKFIACGTAYHASILGARYIQKLCGKKCEACVASEFRYDDNIFDPNCLYVFVSQSGETADTIACAKLVKSHGCSIMCVTNVEYCSLNKFADFLLPTFAGREVAVASTKAYIAQVFTLLLFATKLAKNEQNMPFLRDFASNFEIEPFEERLLDEVKKFKKIFFIGRQADYVTSLEASLKLKEISYINCWGIPAGELKHGTLALVDENTLVIAICTQESLKEKLESNLQEICARGGKILAVSQFDFSQVTDLQIRLKAHNELLMPLVSIVPLQLLAFEFARSLKLNPDMPRNLAKSVTVE